jgi:adenylate cyclase
MTAAPTRGEAGRRLLGQGWRNVRAAGPRRLVTTAVLLVLALLLARFSWQFPGTGDAERALYDVRAFIDADRHRVEQDPRLLVVAYNDQTLIAARKRSPLDRGLLAKALANLDRMGARAIGIDMLFDQPQDEDDELVATLRAMKTPVFVGYADVATNAGEIVYAQQKFLDEFIGRLKGSGARPASVRLNENFGVTRRWPDIIAGLPPVLGRAMLAGAGDDRAKRFAGYTGAIRYRLSTEDSAEIERPVFSSLPIDSFAIPGLGENPDLVAALAAQVKDRYVLVGGDIVDVDRVPTTFTSITGASPPGIEIHAEMIAQMLDGARLPPFASWQLWAIAALVVLCAALTSLLEASVWKALPLLILQLVVIGGAPFLAQQQGMDTLGMPAVGLLLGWVLAFLAVSSAARASGAVERRFAQGALGKYLPADIAQEIIDHPERLTLSGTKVDLYILFSDLEGFTQMSHQLEPEMVATLLNDYLDRLSQVVLDHGGVIDKYVGDAVVAFWGAPIARADDGEKAARCGYAMWQAGEAFRAEVAARDPGLPRIGKTRVGMHYGEAVVGNFGGERRIQYTALGDAMNTAARLESANKPLKSCVMASRELAERSGLDWWRPMGKVVLRGRARPVELCEPAPDFPAADREALAKAMILAENDPAGAAAIVEDVAVRHGSDEALQNLLMRIRNSGEGNAYVLG